MAETKRWRLKPGRKPQKTLTQVFATCQDCHFIDKEFTTAWILARKHMTRTGHRMIIETNYIQIYKRKKADKAKKGKG